MFASVQKCHMNNTDIKAVAKEIAERNASRTAYALENTYRNSTRFHITCIINRMHGRGVSNISHSFPRY